MRYSTIPILLRAPFVYFRSEVKPFHDDANLQQFIDTIVKEKEIKTFCETGTFKGDTLHWFAQRYPEIRCVSIEAFPPYYYMNKLRLHGLKNITTLKGDSGTVLRWLIPKLSQPILFWLDAHWQEHLPLPDELKAIRELKPEGVVLVDDIGDRHYENQEINLDMIRREGFSPFLITPLVAAFLTFP